MNLQAKKPLLFVLIFKNAKKNWFFFFPKSIFDAFSRFFFIFFGNEEIGLKRRFSRIFML